MKKLHKTPEAAEFWNYCSQGSLRLQICADCGVWRYPPSQSCRDCGSASAEWKPVTGKGVIVSFAVFHQDFGARLELPYVIILVELEEGPRMISRLVDWRRDQLRVDLAVKLEFHREAGRLLPLFRPGSGGS